MIEHYRKQGKDFVPPRVGLASSEKIFQVRMLADLSLLL